MWARTWRGFISAVLLGLLATGQQATADDLTNQFESIKEFLVDTVADTQRVGAATTYQLLRDNLAAFRQLKQRVDQVPHIDHMIDELSSELDIIAGNFERAANMRRDYAALTVQSESDLAGKRHQTRAAIANLDRQVAVRQLELQQAQNGTIADPERRRIIIGANTSIINSLQAQIEIWTQFEETQQRLASSLKLSTEKVDLLLFVLEKNAQVYRAAADTAQLRQSVRLALANLQSLGAIEGTLADLAASWQEVDQIIGEIGGTKLGYVGS